MPEITLTKPPYTISNTGYASFTMSADIFFQDVFGLKKPLTVETFLNVDGGEKKRISMRFNKLVIDSIFIK